jgi:hypothetical protein
MSIQKSALYTSPYGTSSGASFSDNLSSHPVGSSYYCSLITPSTVSHLSERKQISVPAQATPFVTRWTDLGNVCQGNRALQAWSRK